VEAGTGGAGSGQGDVQEYSEDDKEGEDASPPPVAGHSFSLCRAGGAGSARGSLGVPTEPGPPGPGLQGDVAAEL